MPATAGDVDQFQDTDGCPDNDNDKDLIADRVDRCPTIPRIWMALRTQTAATSTMTVTLCRMKRTNAPQRQIDQFQDEDGCPVKTTTAITSRM